MRMIKSAATTLAAIALVAAAAIGVSSVALAAPGATSIPASPAPSELTAAEKDAFLAAEDALRATAPKTDKSKDPGRPTDTSKPEPPATGLLGARTAPIAGGQFTPENEWAGWTDATTYTQVWAGDSPDDPGKGLVFVVRRAGANGLLSEGVEPVSSLIRPASVGGPLRIVRVDGADLIVANPGGHEFRFNPAATAFK
jgi:hypothetical protein